MCNFVSDHIVKDFTWVHKGIPGRQLEDFFVQEVQNTFTSEFPPRMRAMVVNRLPLASPGLETEFERVEVRRSGRRHKTISAEIAGDVLVISIPERMSRAE